jgi:hypothetical protein
MPLIFNKESMQVFRREPNQYNIEMEFINDKIDMKKLIDFPSLYLLQELNKDIIEKMNIYNTCSGEQNSTVASIFILYKHFFKDFGLSQLAAHLNIKRTEFHDYIEFKTVPTNNTDVELEFTTSADYSMLPFDNFLMKFILSTPNTVKLIINVEFNIQFDIPTFIEKTSLQIFYKIFTRIQKFIEKC